MAYGDNRLAAWLRWRAAVGAPLVCLFLFHVYFGANQTVASLIMVMGLALCVLASCLADRGRVAVGELGQHWPLAIFALILPLLGLWSLNAHGSASELWSAVGDGSIPATLDRSATLVEIVKFGGAGAAFVLGFLATRRRDGGEIALRILQILGLLYALWALSSYVGHHQIFHSGRLTGGFGSPNTAATLMAALAAISLGQTMTGLATAGYGAERWLLRVALPGLTALALMSAVALTGSRAGLAVGLAGCGLVLLSGVFNIQTRQFRRPLLIVGGAVLVLIVVAARLTQGRVDGAAEAAAIRYDMLAPHWRAFQEHPWTGYGWGGFDPLNHLLLPQSQHFNSVSQSRAMHNVYLQALVEVGAIGLAAFALIVAYVLGCALLGWRAMGPRQQLAAGVLTACLVFLAHGVVDYALQVPSMAMQWSWLLGLLLGLATPPASARRRGSRSSSRSFRPEQSPPRS